MKTVGLRVKIQTWDIPKISVDYYTMQGLLNAVIKPLRSIQ